MTSEMTLLHAQEHMSEHGYSCFRHTISGLLPR